MTIDDGQPMDLLSLPVELRLRIYRVHLQDTIIRIPERQMNDALALILTCRTIHTEASPLIFPNVTFSIYCTEHMIYFLSSLPRQTVESIRHIAIWGTPVGLYEDYPNVDSYRTSFFTDVLPAFPGLQLDTLSIRDAFHGPLATEYLMGDISDRIELENFITKGKGWKELRFLSPNRWFVDVMMRDMSGTELPKQWDDELKKRDGKRSGASVQILLGREMKDYVAKSYSYNPGAWYTDSEEESGEEEEAVIKDKKYLIDPDDVHWEDFDEMAPWREEEFVTYNSEKNIPAANALGEKRRVVVIARRGKDADIVEDGSGLRDEIKRLLDTFEGDWGRMKRKEVLVDSHRDPCGKL